MFSLADNQVACDTSDGRSIFDQAIQELDNRRVDWTGRSLAEKIQLIDETLPRIQQVASDWVAAGTKAKGTDFESPLAGEEWLTGPYITARNLRLIRQSLRDIDQVGTPQLPGRPYVQAGQVVAPVFPTDRYDQLMSYGYKAAVWMKPGIQLSELTNTMGLSKNTKSHGNLCLILGAGNVSSIAPTDAFYKLFVENQVVLLKMHPVNKYLGNIFEKALQPILNCGALRIVYGEKEEGTYLCHHPSVDEIHITGSDKTHDAIVFGEGQTGHQQKESCRPLLKKPITSELGNVSGVIIMPGSWRKRDLHFQAENIAATLVNNASCNCNTTRVIITHRDWNQREDFLNAIRQQLGQIAPRKAYYPGTHERFNQFTDAHPEAEHFGHVAADELPWTLISGLNAENRDDPCFTTEPFCPVMAETPIVGDDIDDFLDQAVHFVNDTLWGTLSASIIVDPKTQRNAKTNQAIERAISQLRVGTVAVNHWAGVSYAMNSTTWGAFPGHELSDIRSGRGVVHNTYMFSEPEKSVLRGPFRPPMTPPWFPSHRQPHRLGPKLVAFECHPSIFRLPGIFYRAFA